MPWMWKSDWAAGQIAYSAKKRMLLATIIAAYWNLVTSPLWFVLPNEILHKKNTGIMFGLIFPAIGLALILWTITEILRWRKFGTSTLRLDSLPGIIGGQLKGLILTSAKVHPKDGFRLTLSCTQTTTTSGGGKRSTSIATIWKKKQIAHELLDNVAEMSAIPVVFQVPYDCRPTDETDPNNKICWRLKVSAGFNFSATFEVPIFKTHESDPQLTETIIQQIEQANSEKTASLNQPTYVRNL